MVVEVFKTNVPDKESAAHLTGMLRAHFPGCRISFDLDDCDRVLRIEGTAATQTVIRMMNANGFACVVLDD